MILEKHSIVQYDPKQAALQQHIQILARSQFTEKLSDQPNGIFYE